MFGFIALPTGSHRMRCAAALACANERRPSRPGGPALRPWKSRAGAATLDQPLTASSWLFQFNDNDGDSFVGAGDIILLNQTAGVIEAGYRIELVRSDSTLTGPHTLPG